MLSFVALSVFFPISVLPAPASKMGNAVNVKRQSERLIWDYSNFTKSNLVVKKKLTFVEVARTLIPKSVKWLDAVITLRCEFQYSTEYLLLRLFLLM
ncbi:hypothetical protein Q1695_012045 [Nippostrongylus brasiliensis]|nr:hypothetical protein Q1695_012045 [Nippostrongylus brasiliensis]